MHPMETLHIEAQEELAIAAEKALDAVSSRMKEGSAGVLALKGDLGAGKTAFTQALARLLGIQEDVTSPTFVVMKQYEIDDTKKVNTTFTKLVHIDAYRIDDIDEMRPLRFEELLHEQGTLICIEWAERIASLLPADALFIDIATTGETSRDITFA